MPKKKTFLTVNRKIIFILVLILGIIAGIFFAGGISIFSNAKTYSITLAEEGFTPKELTIEVGDTVVFKTTRDIEFWPASNLHPSHEIYSDFDPKQPIQPDKTWSFTFKQAGEWGYHDHLFSYYRGTITVLPKNTSHEVTISNCEGNDAEKLQCWDKQIDTILASQGLPQAFTYLEKMFSSEGLFATNCHDFAHKLGDKAYNIFSKGDDVELTPKTYYCGYGFYHGFMEKLLQQSGDMRQAQQFCDYAQEKLKEQTSDAGGACFHGIGHGAVDGSDPRSWGNVKEMMKPGMELCERVKRTEHELYRCVTGVYNAIEILSWDSKYKLQSLQEDPFTFCNSEPQEFKEGCHTNITMAIIFRDTDQNFLTTTQKLEKGIQEGTSFEIRYSVIAGLFHEFLRINLHDSDYAKKGIALCHSLSEQSRKACIDGLAGGHMKYGEPSKEYIKGLAFCGSNLLTSEEKNICYRHILSRLLIWYPPQKAKEVCQSAPAEQQKYCSIIQ